MHCHQKPNIKMESVFESEAECVAGSACLEIPRHTNHLKSDLLHILWQNPSQNTPENCLGKCELTSTAAASPSNPEEEHWQRKNQLLMSDN